MSDYWLGVLSVPALILGLAAGWLALKAVGLLGERLLVGGLLFFGMKTSLAKRTATASVIYGAKRSYMLAGGDLGIVLVVGMDGDRAATAVKRLEDPPVSLNEIRRRGKAAS